MTEGALELKANQRPWWLLLIDGVLAIIIGGLLLWGQTITKIETYLFIVYFLGFWWLFQGVFDLIYMFVDHRAWGWKLFMGIVSIVAGLAIIQYPLIAALLLPKVFVLVLGIWGLLEGIILLIMAFQGGGWGAGILGVLAIIFGIVLMVNYSVPGMGLAFLWVASVSAVIGGIAMIVQAFRQRKA
jgi:uncharacterized membrane protein HdeD (DUF308 family)